MADHAKHLDDDRAARRARAKAAAAPEVARIQAAQAAEQARLDSLPADVRARLDERVGRRPLVRYTASASTGIVRVVHGDVTIAVLRRDPLFGWVVDDAHPSIANLIDPEWHDSRRRLLDEVARAYTRAWQAGEVQ